MSLPRYPEYKDSGVEWLGEVPAHWRLVPLGRVTRSRCDGPFGSGLKSEHYTDNGVRVVRLQNIRRDGFDGTDEAFIDLTYYRAELTGHDVVAGDVLIAGLGDDNNTVGRACVAPIGIEPAMVKADCFRFRLNQEEVHTAFVAAALTATATMDAGRLSTGSTRSRIPLSVMATRKLALPPLAEQAHIAEFLDCETAKIDALVAEQQRLIELLKEKRQAVISYAVTKGLNPNAPMKDSGIEWLGEVPAHWTIGSVRHFIDRIEQGWSPECFARSADADEWGVLKAGCVNRGVFAEQENKALPDILEPVAGYEVRAGDVLMSRASGSPELVGSTAFVAATRPKLMLSDKIFRIHVSAGVHPQFFVAAFNSHIMRAQIERAISGADGLANNLPQSALLTFSFAVPPECEQESIVPFLTSETRRLESLIAEATRAIDLLQERRTALISAAVTGQIDVRPRAQKT